MCAGRAKEYSFRLGTGGRRPKGVGHIHTKWAVYATRQTVPTMPSMARVNGEGSIQGLPSSPQSSVIRMPTATPDLLFVSVVA